jgi:hypothetical protein
LFEKHGWHHKDVKVIFLFFGIHVFMLNNIQKKIPKDFATKAKQAPLTYKFQCKITTNLRIKF